ncbi:MAG TPA: hypothetical protein VLJ16_15155 [Acidobacteriota bacterium]|nr:hypothetical protein [Acidobacteriota bacterium]
MAGKKRVVRGVLAGIVIGLALGPAGLRPGSQTAQQEPPRKEVPKPSYDYMSNILSRSTHPLGLKEDPAARRMLSQGAVPWAIRAGSRHVLD